MQSAVFRSIVLPHFRARATAPASSCGRRQPARRTTALAAASSTSVRGSYTSAFSTSSSAATAGTDRRDARVIDHRPEWRDRRAVVYGPQPTGPGPGCTHDIRDRVENRNQRGGDEDRREAFRMTGTATPVTDHDPHDVTLDLQPAPRHRHEQTRQSLSPTQDPHAALQSPAYHDNKSSEGSMPIWRRPLNLPPDPPGPSRRPAMQPSTDTNPAASDEAYVRSPAVADTRTLRAVSAVDLDSDLAVSREPKVAMPPALRELVKSGLYRLAVFHALAHDCYACDIDIMAVLADVLERRGASKLARRLRRGIEYELARRAGQVDASSGDSAATSSDVRRRSHAEASALPLATEVRHSRLTDEIPASAHAIASFDTPPRPAALCVPAVGRVRLMRDPRAGLGEPFVRKAPTLLAPPVSGLTHAEHATRDTNVHLAYLLTPTPHRRPLNTRQLLARIARLAAHRGFVPDRVTANLVIRCWLRSGWRARGDPAGARELAHMFALVSAGMTRGNGDVFGLVSAAAAGRRGKTGQGAGSDGPGDAGGDGDRVGADLTYRHHVRPFGKMMMAAMRNAGDRKGAEEVRAWMGVWQLKLRN